MTDLLQRWNAGDSSAAEEVLPQVYDELRRIAQRYFHRERPDHTLQPTALVHEAYLRLIEQPGIRWKDRSHFVGLAARVLRRVLVDHARERNTAKRGGGQRKLPLIESAVLPLGRGPDLLQLDAALDELAAVDPIKAQIVVLRFFGGLTIAETASQLAISPATVGRQWRRAKAWLYSELNGRTEDQG